MDYADWIAHHAKSRPQHIAVREATGGRAVSYAELDRRITLLAAGLAADHRVGPGDRVMVITKNCLEAFELLFACARLGAIFVPVNWRLALPEVRYIARDAEPRVVVHESEFAQSAAAATDATAAAAIEIAAADPTRGYERLLTRALPAGWQPRAVDWESTWKILYTSGTTGNPKGAMLSYRMMYFNVLNFASPVKLGCDSTFLCVMPLFHTGGLNCYATPVFYFGGTVVLMREFDPAQALAMMSDPALRISHFFGVPQIYSALAQLDEFAAAEFPAMVVAGAGGAPASDTLVKRWLDKGVPLQPAYGMTEIGPAITIIPLDRVQQKIGSAGQPAMNLELRITDQTGAPVERGRIGEIRVRGPVVMSGYWRNPAATEAAMGDGWFRTGDAARMDEDGFVFIVDRFKDMYISGGENVYPNEVENVISACPGVLSVAVIGVGDEQWGEVGCAYVVPLAGHTLTAELIEAHCRPNLARYKIPKKFVFVGELPRTASGKVMKRELRILYTTQGAQGR
jgi:fatty-acyl-CoA synthase